VRSVVRLVVVWLLLVTDSLINFVACIVDMQVNLLPGERPRDVYAGVCAEVNKKLAAIAATELGTDATPEDIKAHKYCTMLTGSVDRKVHNC
jgi:DNA-directed RNA polymerase